MLLALHMFSETAKQFFEIIIKILFKSINHAEVIVLLDCFLDILTLKQYLLFSPSNCINKMGVVVVKVVVELVLVYDVLIFSDEEVDLCTSIVLVTFAGARKESNNYSREEMRPQINMIDISMNSLTGK